MTRLRRVAAWVGPLVAIGLVLTLRAYNVRLASAQSGSSVDIPLPDHWVPFSADVVRTTSNSVRAGRFYRSGDGSTARIEESVRGALITIHNVRTNRTYVRFGDAEGWVSSPLVQAGLDTPRTLLQFLPDKVHKLPEPIEGFEAWENSSGPITTRLLPALNGFRVFHEQPGHVEEHRNIRLGEPPAEVFLPPPDVKVAVTNSPGRPPRPSTIK